MSQRAVIGQWLTGSDGVRWHFDSGSLALDFGYTGDYGYGVSQWEQLHSPADLTAWLAERFPGLYPPADIAVLHEARALRAAITSAARSLAAGSRPRALDIDSLNQAAARGGIPPHLAGGTTSAPRPTAGDCLGEIASDAIRVFADHSDRIRHCAANDCRLIFVDTSRPGQRRWCSMRRCGNRDRVRAYRSRQEHTP